jgi:hypothetical protein
MTFKVPAEQVEYFLPHDLEVRVEGMYPNIILDIERVRSDKFLSFVEAAWNNVHDSKVKGLLYPTKDSSEDSSVQGAPNKVLEIRTKIQRHPSACLIAPLVLDCGHSSDDFANEAANQGSPANSSNSAEVGVIPVQATIPQKNQEQLAQEKVSSWFISHILFLKVTSTYRALDRSHFWSPRIRGGEYSPFGRLWIAGCARS